MLKCEREFPRLYMSAGYLGLAGRALYTEVPPEQADLS